jgi:hypothetical protein
MEWNRYRGSPVREEIATTNVHMVGDLARLREIRLGLLHTQRVIESGLAACKASQHLLLRIENRTADQAIESDL